MKALKKQWFIIYGKVLSAAIALLGMVSCRMPQPCMYGVPDPNWKEEDSLGVDFLDADKRDADSLGLPTIIRSKSTVDKTR